MKQFKKKQIRQNPTKGHLGFSWKKCWYFPLVTLFFCGKNVFFEKNVGFLSINSAVKNFRKFFTAELIEKKIRKLLTVYFIEKKFDIFSEKSKKKDFCHKRKRSHRKEIPTFFPGKSDTFFRWVITYTGCVKKLVLWSVNGPITWRFCAFDILTQNFAQ